MLCATFHLHADNKRVHTSLYVCMYVCICACMILYMYVRHIGMYVCMYVCFLRHIGRMSQGLGFIVRYIWTEIVLYVCVFVVSQTVMDRWMYKCMSKLFVGELVTTCVRAKCDLGGQVIEWRFEEKLISHALQTSWGNKSTTNISAYLNLLKNIQKLVIHTVHTYILTIFPHNGGHQFIPDWFIELTLAVPRMCRPASQRRYCIVRHLHTYIHTLRYIVLHIT